MKQTYNNFNWKEFSKGVIEFDGNKCTHCGKSGNEAILQVHHKKYIKGYKLWEYATQDCETVCKGCHASIHGIIKPKFGWAYLGDEDLGGLTGTCENCGASIRYVFTIYHENWGTLEVGTICCDNLTDSDIASNFMESKKKYEGRKERFLKSIRWIEKDGIHFIKQNGFKISIFKNKEIYNIKIHNHLGNGKYESINSAKSIIFDIIENGKLVAYFKSKNIDLNEKKSKKEREKEYYG